METKDNDIIEREARFVIHIPSKHGLPDLHLVKENLHFQNGDTKPNLRWIRNFKRPFWIENINTRTYKQKKEIESLDRLMRYDCTQSELRDKVAEALGVGYSRDHLKKLSNSPYLYGSEISSQAIIKKMYKDRNKTHITPFSVMMFDIETDMVNGTQDPIIMTAVFRKEIYISVVKDFIKEISDPEVTLRSKISQYLTEFVSDIDTYHLHFEVTDDTVDLCRRTFKWIHAQQADMLGIWNMDFDIPKIIDTLKRYHIDPASILCDPSIPESVRVCEYKEGFKKKRKANGQEVPIDYADQWHTLNLTASFYVIDAMCTYRLLRLAKPKESYSLDNILNKELGVRKLRFKEANAYVKDRWHVFMQSNYKVEYMVYAIFDSLSMQLLDQKTLDLSFTLHSFAGITPFSKCNSKPKMIADALHYYVLDKGYVLNSVGEHIDHYHEELEEGEVDESEPDVLSLTNWINTLPSHLVVPGLPLIEENPDITTMIRGMVYDSDCVAAYPNCISILNVSKNTTKREIISIEGVEEDLFRLQNINLCSGDVNSLEYGNQMLGLPTLFDMLEEESIS